MPRPRAVARPAFVGAAILAAAITLPIVGGRFFASPGATPRPLLEIHYESRPLPAAGDPDGAMRAGPSARPIRYGRDVRPILSDRCFLCHGPDRAMQKAELRLDSFAEATREREGGRSAIVPGDPEASELWARVTSHDPDVRMPPSESTKHPLTEAEREIIRRWIEEGAVYEPHWAFIPPQRPATPSVSDEQWCRNEIDTFILAELERAGLSPADEADPALLLRRIFLDLTGLPPTPEEVEAYFADPRPDRYERWIDRLLTEEPYRTRYAERMTAPWLDQARYADTCGIHMDNGRSLWPWRDWVIHAYRDNMPFDRFVVEQLAGDLLPDATLEQKIASGFNRNHITTDEGGVIAEEYLVEYAVDRVSTTGSVLLGLTLGCARCHDHKFDPITMEDFYGLIAFFNSIDEPGLYSQTQDSKRAYEPFLAAPTPEQRAAIDSLQARVDDLVRQRDTPDASEVAARDAFLESLAASAGAAWFTPGQGLEILGAESLHGATITPLDDGSLLASGENPAQDEHVVTLRTEATGLRMIALEALTHPSLPAQRVGRAPNGNAVLGAVAARAVSISDPTQTQNLRLLWAWADVEQENGEYRVTNALDADPGRGWAVGAHFDPEGGPTGRVAIFLADEPFGFEGGTEITLRLDYRTRFDQHTLGRVRLSLGAIDDAGLDLLPVATGGFYRAGQFTTGDRDTVFDTAFGPEQSAAFDPRAQFDGKPWQFELGLQDGRPFPLSGGVGVDYVALEVFAPSARTLDLSLGSDDGIRVFHDGHEVFANRTDRGVGPDQDRATLALTPGRNSIVYKIVNTGGPSGVYSRSIEADAVLPHDLVAHLLPQAARRPELLLAAESAWRTRFSPHFRELTTQIDGQREELAALDAQVPRTMVMKEREMPRPTYVLSRGLYDHPDQDRPVERTIPAALGRMPDDAPRDRLGLARWIVSDDDPLLARVTANRLWELLFAHGLVRTSEDFGLQGEWPTHPELLDWLAVEFRECGWDVQHMLRLMLTSSTYRQNARLRPEAATIDPDNRLLAHFPRQRLTAEQIRDQALYVGGLLVEEIGGESVKPYQPAGLWREIAMPNSNTRIFEMGEGDDLWRRSIYTYWKRASPPPAMLTFDAPTREFCTIRRTSTNTPLQALVLWNDVQFVEASRAAAARTILAVESDAARLEYLYRLCTGRALDEPRRDALAGALDGFRERYLDADSDATALVEIGESPTPDTIDPRELAAWTMLANALLSSDAAIVKN